MATGASEKLAQEGLRGNRDWLAEGKRVGSGVREVSHDLERMRGAGGLRHLYQTDRWVRMVNTKLTDGSEWYDLFNNVAEDCALFLLPQLEQGQNGRKVKLCIARQMAIMLRFVKTMGGLSGGFLPSEGLSRVPI